MKWPPVLFVSGDEDLLRRRFVDEVVGSLEEAGRIVGHTDGKVPGSVNSELDTGLFGDEKIIVVTNPDKSDIEVIRKHNDNGDNTCILLCHIERSLDNRTVFGKFVREFDSQHKVFSKPKPWDADKKAASFCVEEASRYGKSLSSKAAQGLVSVIGSDLGVLQFEVMKAATLADADGSDSIEVVHIKGSVAPVMEASLSPVVQSLQVMDVKRLVKYLGRIRATSKYDPTMKVCRFLGPVVMKWMSAAKLEETGVPPEEAARTLNVSSLWYYANKVLPPAKRWGSDRLIRVLGVLAQSERSVLSGCVDPWTGFVSRLVDEMR